MSSPIPYRVSQERLREMIDKRAAAAQYAIELRLQPPDTYMCLVELEERRAQDLPT